MNKNSLNIEGLKHYHNKNYEKALNCYEKILEIDENNIIALKNKTMILTELGLLNEALTNVNKEISIKETWENLNNKGNILNLLNRVAESIIYYNKALEIDPENEEILYNKAVSLINLYDFETAIKCLDKIKDNPDIIHLKADTLMQLNKDEEALECYNMILNKIDDVDALNNKAVILAKNKKFEEALKCYDKAILLDSKKEELWINKAQILLNLEKYNDAINCFDNALKLNSKNKILWLFKADCYDELNNHEKAEHCYDKYYEK